MSRWLNRRIQRVALGGLTLGLLFVSIACGRPDRPRTSVPSPALPSATAVPNVAVADTLPGAATGEHAPAPTLPIAPTSAAAPPPTGAAADISGTAAAVPLPTRPPAAFADAEPSATRTPLPPATGTCPGGCETPPHGCLIKGTIPAAGLKIYLLPGQPGYDAARIDSTRGERWFCTVNEARSAGWAPAQVPLPAHRSGSNSTPLDPY